MGLQCKELRGWLDAYRRVFSKLPLEGEGAVAKALGSSHYRRHN
jgi:hypothetical protein